MKKTAKTSTAAIIFVMIYFIFIIFISLFKGLHFYNISFSNIKINHIFLKIDKKFTLTAQKIKIIVKKKHITKQTLNIHKTIFLSLKLLPFIKEINLKNIYYNNSLIFKNITLNKNKININGKDFSTEGILKITKKYTFIHLKKLKAFNYLFHNINIAILVNKNYTFINIKATYYNPFYISLKINKNDTILSSIFIPYEKLMINKFDTEIHKCKFYNLYYANSNKLLSNGKCDFIQIKNNFLLTLLNSKIKYNKHFINLKALKSKIKYKDYELNLTNPDSIIDIKNKNIMLEAKKGNLLYKKYKIKAKNLALNIDKDKTLFFHLNDINISDDLNFSAKELLAYKNKKIYFFIKNNHLKSKYFTLNTNKIKGNKKLIYLSDIIGKILNFNSFIKSPTINIQTKTAKSKLIKINDINLTNNKIYFNKKITFHTQTTTLFNNNLKEILNYFKINIPLLQLKGKNNLNLNLNYETNKTIKIVYDLNSSKSLWNFKDFNFTYNKLNIKGDLNKSDINITDFTLPYKYLNIKLDSNISINIPHKYINSLLHIQQLNIDKYLQIKNLNEKIAIDLLNNFVFFLKSSIFINLNTKTIFFYNLENLLKFSPFYKIFNSGEAIISLLKNKLLIFVNANLNYPLILNQKNPKNLKITMDINKTLIKIENPHINAKIENFEKIEAYNHDINLSIEGMLNIINDINEIIKNLHLNKTNSNSSLNVLVTSKNTNFIYKNHTFLTDKANLKIGKEIEFNATYKQSRLKGYTKKGFLLIEGTHYTKSSLVPLLEFFKTFKKVDLDFVVVKSPENFYIGKVYINSGIIDKLKSLNNLVAFINTIPALLSLNTPGFSSKGYKIKKGFISYIFFNNILYFKQIKITGKNLDFNGKGYINLSKNKIKLKIDTVIKIKLKKIPIIGKGISYILFGKDGYLHVNVIIKGNLDNPKIEKNIIGNPIETPFKLFKRIITLPFNLF